MPDRTKPAFSNTASSPDNHSVCWVVSDGKIGIDNQCIGLAEALGLTPVVKHVSMRSPWRHLFPLVPFLHPHAFRPGDALFSPWPALLITGGRSGAAVSLFVKKASGGKTVTVHIQNPHLTPRHFDLLVAGEHDGVRPQPGVLAIKGALNRVTAEAMTEAAARFPQLASMSRPRVAVLLGGANRCYTFGPKDAADLAGKLAKLERDGASVMITASRRTGPENIAVLQRALAEPPCYFWDGTGENPYFAMLELADHILVTPDSISMVSEAATTGKPVHVIDMPGGDAKFRAFHQTMRDAGVTRPFDGRLAAWNYQPLRDTQAAAGLVKSILARKLMS